MKLVGDNNAAYAAFVEEHRDSMYRLAMVLTTDSHRAQDLVQSTLTRVLERWDQVSAATHQHAYARRVMVNLFMTEARKPRREFPLENAGPLPTEHPGHEIVEARDLGIRLLRDLPPRQRAAMALRFLEDKTDVEIASILGCTQPTVRSLISRGIRTARRNHAAQLRTLGEHI